VATDVESSEGGTRAGPNLGADAPTRELSTAPAAASEDRCGVCGTPLAHDQRYCVECGERRGASRFPAGEPAAEVPPRRTRAARPPRGQRMSSGTTLVAGVGVLLLAIGLGVLIGRLGHNNSSNQKASAPPVQVVTVQGGGGSAAATTTSAATTPAHHTAAAAAAASSVAPKGLTGKLKAAAENKAPPTKALQQKATQAAGKVLGNSSNIAPPTQKVGGSCKSTQAGCQSGKFTGNFFGGGQ
jgi:hypothetical protein